MTRVLWLAVNLMLLGGLIGAGWFAATAPQLARPALAPLGEVALDVDEPPVPPSPVVRSVGDAGELLARRQLFNSPIAPETALSPSTLAARQDVVDAPLPTPAPTQRRDVRLESPIARTVLDTLPTPHLNAPAMDERYRSPIDPLRARMALIAPSVVQLNPPRSLPEDERAPDTPAPDATEPGVMIVGAPLETPVAEATPPASPPAAEDVAQSAEGASADVAEASPTEPLDPAVEREPETLRERLQTLADSDPEIRIDAGPANQYAPSTTAQPGRAPRPEVEETPAIAEAEDDGAPATEPTPTAETAEPATEPAADDAVVAEAPRPSLRPTRAAPTTQTIEAAVTTRIEPTDAADGGLILLGVITRLGDERALIRTANGDARRIRLGDEVGGWTVTAIRDNLVEMRRASETRLLTMP